MNRVPVGHHSLLVLSRTSEYAPGERGWIVLNRDWDQSAQLSIHELTATDGAITVLDLTLADQCRAETHAESLLEIEPARVLFLYQMQ